RLVRKNSAAVTAPLITKRPKSFFICFSVRNEVSSRSKRLGCKARNFRYSCSWLVFVNDHDHGSRARSKALAGLELRQLNAAAGIFEYPFHRHVDVDLIDGAADDVAAETRAVVQVDPRRDIRNVGREAAQRLTDNLAYHGEGENFARASDLYPF